MKRFLTYLVLLGIYIFLPVILQQIFMIYDDYYFYLIVTLLLVINTLFAFIFLKFPNKIFYFLAGICVTLIEIISFIVVVNLFLDPKTIQVCIISYAISSILAWEIIHKLNRQKKTAANTGNFCTTSLKDK